MKLLPVFRILFFAIILFAACQSEGNSRSKQLGILMEEIKSPVVGKRDSALLVMNDFLFVKDDVEAIYSALDLKYIGETEKNYKVKERLISVLGDIWKEDTPVFLSELYIKSSEIPILKQCIMGSLAEINTPESVDALKEILLKSKAGDSEAVAHALLILEKKPEHLARLFPDIVALIEIEELATPVLESLHLALSEKLVLPSALPEAVELISEAIGGYTKYADRFNSDWKYRPREATAAGLYCLGFFPENKTAVRRLEQHIDYLRANVSLASVLAMSRQNHPKKDSFLKVFVAEPSRRNMLYMELEESNELEIFPADYLNQQSLAEADLAGWLLSSRKSGIAGDLEFLKKIELTDSLSSEEGRIFVFSFETGKGEKLIGISGPQPLDSTQVIGLGRLTSSKFRKVEDRSLNEHIIDLLKQ